MRPSLIHKCLFSLSMLWVLLILPLSFAATPNNGPLSEAEIRSFITTIEKAANTRNYSVMKSFYAPEMRLFADLDGQGIQMTYQDIDEALKANGKQVTQYHQNNHIDSFKITGNRAEVKLTTTEETTLINGQKRNMLNKMVLTLEKRNGKVLIVKEMDKIITQKPTAKPPTGQHSLIKH